MIRPEGFRGTAFGTLADGDLRFDAARRRAVAGRLAIRPEWAFVTQVHGADVRRVTAPGLQGEADAMYTTVRDLPLAVATADCVPVILEGPEVVAVIHAGWRGAANGVVRATLDALGRDGLEVTRAALGPAIGPGCYEVGAEVASRFPEHVATTTWGSTSVDLPGAVAAQLGSLVAWRSPSCTFTDDRLASYRRNRTDARQVAVAWLPND